MKVLQTPETHRTKSVLSAQCHTPVHAMSMSGKCMLGGQNCFTVGTDLRGRAPDYKSGGALAEKTPGTTQRLKKSAMTTNAPAGREKTPAVTSDHRKSGFATPKWREGSSWPDLADGLTHKASPSAIPVPGGGKQVGYRSGSMLEDPTQQPDPSNAERYLNIGSMNTHFQSVRRGMVAIVPSGGKLAQTLLEEPGQRAQSST